MTLRARPFFPALTKLGFGGAVSATVGKLIELKVESSDEISAERDARRMCSELFANPVIEVFSVDVKPAEAEKVRG